MAFYETALSTAMAPCDSSEYSNLFRYEPNIPFIFFMLAPNHIPQFVSKNHKLGN